MSQTWTVIDNSAQDVPTVNNNLQAQTVSLRSNFSGTSAPGAIVEGQWFVDTTTASDPIPYFRANSAWVCVGNLKARAAKDMNDFELTNARIENLGADPAASGSKIGRVFYNIVDEKIKYDDGATIQTVHTGDVTAVRQLPMSDVGLDDTNPPTAGTAGTTPTNRGWLFDAVNELYSFTVRVPTNWKGDGDILLDLDCVLPSGQVTGEDIAWTMDWVAYASGEDATKTSTNVTSATEISGTTTAGTMYRCTLNFDYDDSDNPITAGDILVGEIHLTTIASVASVVVAGASMRYTANNAG